MISLEVASQVTLEEKDMTNLLKVLESVMSFSFGILPFLFKLNVLASIARSSEVIARSYVV